MPDEDENGRRDRQLQCQVCMRDERVRGKNSMRMATHLWVWDFYQLLPCHWIPEDEVAKIAGETTK